MAGKTAHERTGCATAVAAATLSIAALAAPARPLTAQEVIELPAEDLPLDADFEEFYRVGSLHGDGWDTFGSVGTVGFDGSGNLYILDTEAVRINVVDLQANLVRQFMREGQRPRGVRKQHRVRGGVCRHGGRGGDRLRPGTNGILPLRC